MQVVDQLLSCIRNTLILSVLPLSLTLFWEKKRAYYSVIKITPLLMPSMVKLLHGDAIKLGPPQGSCSTTLSSCCFLTPFSVSCSCPIALKYHRPINFMKTTLPNLIPQPHRIIMHLFRCLLFMIWPTSR